MNVVELLTKQLFGKRWRGTYMYTFHSEPKSEALTK